MRSETTVIIPNFNGKKHLEECLNSLKEQTYKRFRVILVDDCSSDNSAGFAKNIFPDIDIIVNGKNIGFTKSINRGIKYSLGKYLPKYIALLNNDTKTDKKWLEELIKTAESEKGLAAVASNMFFYDNPEIINSQGGTCNFIGMGKDINFGRNRRSIIKTQRDVLSPCFGACLIKADAIKDIGLPDERYFSYGEDLDWGQRARSLGYKIIFSKDAVVYHKWSASWNKYPKKKIYLCNRNYLCTIIKNYRYIKLFFALILTLIYYIRFLGAYILNIKIENRKIAKIDKKMAIGERIACGFQPFFGIVWNIKELKNTLRLRREKEKKYTAKERFAMII